MTNSSFYVDGGGDDVLESVLPGGSGTNLPLMDGTASAGVSHRWSREDHVHPTDISRAPNAFVQAGVGAVTRTVHEKLRDHVSAKDFGVDMTGATDSAAALTNALAAAAATSGVLTVPAGIVRLDSTITIPPGVTLIGAGMPSPHAFAQGAYPSGTPGNCTWFFFNHTSFGFFILTDWTSGNTIGEGSRHLMHFGTYRTQPVPGGGAYTPTNHQWDFIIIASNDVYLSDIMMLNPSRGIYVSGSDAEGHGSGRVDMHRIFGQPLITGIQLEYVYDTCRVDHVHFWPFWSTNANVMASTKATAVALLLGRCDNPQVDSFFSYAYHRGLSVYNNATVGSLPGGTLSNGQFGLFQCDAGDVGVAVEGDSASFTMDQLITFGSAGAPYSNNPRAFSIAANNCLIRIGDLYSAASGSRHGEIGGSGNRVRIGCLTTTQSDLNATGLAQFLVGAGNYLNIDGEPVTDAALDKLVSGAGYASGNFWRSYTPVVTGASGTLTAATADARYQRIGETVDVIFNIDTSNNGTAATAVLFSLPVTSSADFPYPLTIGVAREMAVNGKECYVWIASPGATNAIINVYDNSYPGGTGTKLTGTIRYRGVV